MMLVQCANVSVTMPVQHSVRLPKRLQTARVSTLGTRRNAAQPSRHACALGGLIPATTIG